MNWFCCLPCPLQYCFIFGVSFICTTSVAFVYQYYTVYKVKKKKSLVSDGSEKNQNLEVNLENKPNQRGSLEKLPNMAFLSNNKESFCSFFENETGENEFELNTEKDFIPFFTEDKLEYFIKKSVLCPSSKVAVENVDDDFSEQKMVRKIVILGLENSGKSTLLAQLSKKGNHYIEYKPTKGFNVKCISFDNCDLSIWEIGGEEDYRVYWRNFSDTTDMIIFVIDSSERNKFKSAKTFFSEILGNLHETVDLHIVATKVDKNQSASLEELYLALELEKSIWEIHQVSMVTEDATKNIGIAQLQQLCLGNGDK
ncbi:uncharacterized protein LOC136078218 [Hydra vulgaris]|uniref:Uncharacterized protein LOC136078218 n=1 Tax=Hydra vulgaris TaxID=6087 RepID=A0ABM4BKH2_HYDVU